MRFLLFILLFVLGTLAVNAQDVVRGIVVDSASFSPLAGVHVRIKHQNKGTVTDVQGNFGVQAQSGDTLVLTLVGYDTLELPVAGWDPSVILLSEKVTMLKTITIRDQYINPYDGMFDEQNERLRKMQHNIRFYYSKAKKEKLKVKRLENENLRVKTYVDVIINTPETKEYLVKKHKLSEDEYYTLLTQFNEANYQVMYYLTAPELISLLNNFYARHAPR